MLCDKLRLTQRVLYTRITVHNYSILTVWLVLLGSRQSAPYITFLSLKHVLKSAFWSRYVNLEQEWQWLDVLEDPFMPMKYAARTLILKKEYKERARKLQADGPHLCAWEYHWTDPLASCAKAYARGSVHWRNTDLKVELFGGQ